MMRRRRALIGVGASCVVATTCERVGTKSSSSSRATREEEVRARYEKAESALRRGKEAVVNGDSKLAIEAFSEAIDAAPERYKTAMPALLGRRDARRELGDNVLAADDARREWLWGRGVRCTLCIHTVVWPTVGIPDASGGLPRLLGNFVSKDSASSRGLLRISCNLWEMHPKAFDVYGISLPNAASLILWLDDKQARKWECGKC